MIARYSFFSSLASSFDRNSPLPLSRAAFILSICSSSLLRYASNSSSRADSISERTSFSCLFRLAWIISIFLLSLSTVQRSSYTLYSRPPSVSMYLISMFLHTTWTSSSRSSRRANDSARSLPTSSLSLTYSGVRAGASELAPWEAPFSPADGA